jgi:polygalacturonase
VLIPAGHFLTGAIFLRSRVEVELEPGAILLASTNFADYPAIDGRWEGIERKIYASLFNGRDLEHVSITGHGVLEGQGSVWWDAQRKTMAMRRKLGLVAREPDNPPDAPLRWPRPRMINLYSCTNVVLRDITILNSPSWNVHPVYCEHFLMDNVTVISPANSPNTDAVDPDSCKDVHISNCYMDVGDDCVVIKSGFNADGRRVGRPCEDVLINNCTFAHGHGGVVIGSEMSGSVRNVVVENCICDGTQRGLRVKTALGRGGVIEHFRVSNMVMRNILDTAFSITAAYGDGQEEPDSAKTAAETIPVMRHIHWSNISVVNAKRLGDISSLQQSPLEDFSLRNVQAVGAQAGIRCNNAKGLVFENISIAECNKPAFEAQQVTSLEIRGLSVPADEDAPVLLFKKVSGAFISDCSVTDGKGVFLKLGEGNTDIVTSANRLGADIKERE